MRWKGDATLLGVIAQIPAEQAPDFSSIDWASELAACYGVE